MPKKTSSYSKLSPQALQALYKKIGYTFCDETRFWLAMTHPSFLPLARENNQRLEFLGDALVGCIVAVHLFKLFPDTQEGVLTRLRSQLVRKESLACCARALGLAPFLQLGVGERRQYPQGSDAMLADALEALIAAIYLDSDWATCERVVIAWFEGAIADISLDITHMKDPKSQLQEHMQKHKQALPVYTVIPDDRPGCNTHYVARCAIAGGHVFTGYGASKRKAEQAAAKAAVAAILSNSL